MAIRKSAKRPRKQAYRYPKRPIKDPKKPKQPLNSYILYYLDTRKQIVENLGHPTFGEVAKACSRDWKAYPSQGRTSYMTRAREGQIRYRRRLRSYRAPSQEELEARYGIRPRALTGAYAYFVKKEYNIVMRRFPAYGLADISRYLAKTWAGMTEEERKPFQVRAKIDQRRRNIEWNLYRDGRFNPGNPRKYR